MPNDILIKETVIDGKFPKDYAESYVDVFPVIDAQAFHNQVMTI
jgi:hypothetical protein